MWLVLPAFAAEVPTLISPPGLATRTVVAPKFQPGPADPPERCLVRVVVDEGGLPVEVAATGCSAPLAASAEDAVRAWRWGPVSSGGGPARALTYVAVAFTGRGRLPVAAAERCAYTLVVGADGRVRTEGSPGPQCAIWPTTSVAGPIPAAGTCTVSVDTTVRADTSWYESTDCALDAVPVAMDVVGASLLVLGTASTRVVLKLPEGVTGEDGPLHVDVGAQPTAPVPGRLPTDAPDDRADPTLDVPEDEVPKVDLSELLKKPAPAPAPAPNSSSPRPRGLRK